MTRQVCHEAMVMIQTSPSESHAPILMHSQQVQGNAQERHLFRLETRAAGGYQDGPQFRYGDCIRLRLEINPPSIGGDPMAISPGGSEVLSLSSTTHVELVGIVVELPKTSSASGGKQELMVAMFGDAAAASWQLLHRVQVLVHKIKVNLDESTRQWHAVNTIMISDLKLADHLFNPGKGYDKPNRDVEWLLRSLPDPWRQHLKGKFNDDQLRAIADACPPGDWSTILSLIQGPPGTGKTTTIALIANLWRNIAEQKHYNLILIKIMASAGQKCNLRMRSTSNQRSKGFERFQGDRGGEALILATLAAA